MQEKINKNLQEVRAMIERFRKKTEEYGAHNATYKNLAIDYDADRHVEIRHCYKMDKEEAVREEIQYQKDRYYHERWEKALQSDREYLEARLELYAYIREHHCKRGICIYQEIEDKEDDDCEVDIHAPMNPAMERKIEEGVKRFVSEYKETLLKLRSA
ncbi:MAG: hypothetical protein ABIG66_00220 [Candidatus Kerfeldbacteria bacterium]